MSQTENKSNKQVIISMFRKYIWLPIFVFTFGTVFQLIFYSEIQWVYNIMFSVVFYLIYVFWEWSKKPYDWNKNKTER